MRSRSLPLCAILFFLSSVSVGFAAPQDGCSLPADLHEELAGQYPNAHVVSLADLVPDDKTLFQKEHGSDCPGISKVDFYGDGKPTLALVLLLDEKDGAQTQLIVAHEIQHGWELKRLEQDITGPAPVVWSERPGKYHDVYGEKTINAINPVIVLCAYDSWAILYAWTGKRVEKIWIRD